MLSKSQMLIMQVITNDQLTNKTSPEKKIVGVSSPNKYNVKIKFT